MFFGFSWRIRLCLADVMLRELSNAGKAFSGYIDLLACLVTPVNGLEVNREIISAPLTSGTKFWRDFTEHNFGLGLLFGGGPR